MLKRVLAALVAGGGEARVAGGVVRNALLGEPVADDVDVVDIATTELPERVIALAERAGFAVHPTGLSHGTVTVVASGDGRVRPFEAARATRSPQRSAVSTSIPTSRSSYC